MKCLIEFRTFRSQTAPPKRRGGQVGVKRGPYKRKFTMIDLSSPAADPNKKGPQPQPMPPASQPMPPASQPPTASADNCAQPHSN